MSETLLDAFLLLGGFDAALLQIVGMSLWVSCSAVAIAVLIGLPVGALIAIGRFPGRDAAMVILNAMMGLPSVIVGVVVYLALSRSGPFGPLGLLFTPAAMIVAQTILTAPLIAALTRQIVEDAYANYEAELRLMGYRKRQAIAVLLYDCRYSLVVAVLAGLGRAMSEVGAVMMVGGNIAGFTRVMTTAIALETSKGDLPLSLALGIVLVTLVLALNAAAHTLRRWAMKRFG